jgi:hypothetical protein
MPTKVVNKTDHLINSPSGVMMAPGQEVELSDEDMANARIKEMMEAKEIGPPGEDDGSGTSTVSGGTSTVGGSSPTTGGGTQTVGGGTSTIGGGTSTISGGA